MATITAKELAVACDTDARTVRKFLRSDANTISPVGKGSRYAIEKRQVKSLSKAFAAWEASRTAAKEPEVEETPKVNLDKS